MIRILLLSLLGPLLLATAPLAAAPVGPARPDAEGFIRDWLVLAPIFYQGLWPAGEPEVDRQSLPGEARLRPSAGATVRVDAATLTWKPAQTAGYDLDLAANTGLSGEALKYKLAYAVTYVVSGSRVKGARLRVGSSDLVKVYWNGKPVISHRGTRSVGKDQNAALVDIDKGVNVLVAKVINDEREWGLAARLVMAGGAPVPGLSMATTGDGKGVQARPDAEGFVRNWLVLGPIPYATRPYAEGQLAKKQVPNEEKLQPKAEQRTWVNTGELPWKVYKAQDFFIDFDAFQKTMRNYTPPARVEKHNDTLFRALGYAATYVSASADLVGVTAKIGANDHGLLYVNGKEVVRSDVPGALQKDRASGTVTLRKGVNTLVFKVINAGDSWSGCVRFVDRQGKPLTDLEVTTVPPLTEEQRLASD